ncbi:MAG: ATP-dependent helicase [Acidimicrobiia bacterium]
MSHEPPTSTGPSTSTLPGREASGRFPGPGVLGRSVVVTDLEALRAADLEAATHGWPVVTIGAEQLNDPRSVADLLHQHWLRRDPMVIVMAIDPATLRVPEVDHREPWQLTPEFEFSRERLQFLVWANSWDLRSGTAVWWWGRKAARLGEARERNSTDGDITLPDGTAAWVDGGPRQTFPSEVANALGTVVHRESVELGQLSTMTDGPCTAELTADQLDAVTHAVGPARIIAPAGSGKTRVLTERLRVLRALRGWESETVTTLAYNRRAVDELEERTVGLGAHLRTINSAGLAIINGTGGFARPGGRRPRQVIEEYQVRRIIGDLITVPRQANSDPYAAYIEGLRLIRRALVSPEAAEKLVDADGLSGLFDRYCQQLEDNNLVDFDGQQYEAIKVLLTDPRSRAVAQARCRHLLVDEFQDLTPADVLLIRLLAAPGYDVFGVGDDDQVIYGFGGASPRFLVSFDRYFPGATSHALSVNYRCPPAVVTSATTLLGYNRERVDKAVRPAPGRLTIAGEFEITTVDPLQEASVAADRLERWAAEGGSYDQMAVLARVNSVLLPIQVTCTERSIPCRRAIDATILDRTGMRTALAYLRIAVNPGDITAADIAETIRRPSRRIARNVVEMTTKRRRHSIASVEALASRLTGRDRFSLEDYCTDLRLVAATASTGSTVEVVRVIRDEVGLGGAMEVLDQSKGAADRSTHRDDLEALEQVAALHDDPHTFEQWLRSVLTRPTTPNNTADRVDASGDATGAGVELSSIHRVKGREWDHVIVIGADAELLPHRLTDDEEEERRLLHVAITRGRQEVVVLADRDRPSPFVAELTTPAPPESERTIVRSRGNRPNAEVKATSSANTAAASSADPTILAALKRWRAQTARRANVPAYVVFSDAHLEGIASARPSSERELARCAGVGPTKLERYGDEVLAIIDACVTSE